MFRYLPGDSPPLGGLIPVEQGRMGIVGKRNKGGRTVKQLGKALVICHGKGLLIIVLGPNIGRIAVDECAGPVVGLQDLFKASTIEEHMLETRLNPCEKGYGRTIVVCRGVPVVRDT